MRALATFFAALFGLAFGSFLNVCLSRWPQGESIVAPRSHCRQCGRTLAWWENIPLVSWIALRGRCRTCHTWIGLRYPLVEAAVAFLWAILAWRTFSFDPESAHLESPLAMAIIGIAGMAFVWLLVALAVLDSEHLWLPDRLTIPGILAGLVSVTTFTAVNSGRVLEYYGALGLRSRIVWQVVWHRMLAILAAAALVLVIRWLYWLIRRREGLGLGDAKLMALLAAWLGLPGALLAFVLGALLGALTALALLAVPALRRDNAAWSQQRLPLGTFLCIGGIVGALWGQPILAAYMRWAGF